MDIWSILEIEPTTETSIIKKAYAKKLKIFHPEDDPEGYQKLREAFDSALKYAKNNKVQHIKENNVSGQNNLLEQHEPLKENNLSEQNEHTEEHKLIEQNEFKQEENDDDLSSKKFRKLKIIEESHLYKNDDLSNKKFRKLKIIEEYHYNESNDSNYSNDFEKSKQLIDQLFENLTDLYKDFFKRIEIKNWQEALNAEIIWHLDFREDISRRMIKFLDDHRHIPQNILQFLNDDFKWTENEEKLKSYSNYNFLSYFYSQINGEKGNRYCYFRKDIQIDYDKYLDYRDTAAKLIRQNKIYEVWQYLEPAYNMYSYDPDLLCMMGEYYLREKGKWKKHIWAFNAASKLNEEDIETKLYQAEIFLKTENVKQAIKLCKVILKNKPEDFDVKTTLGICYWDSEKWVKASKIFLKNFKIKPSDVLTRQKLYIIIEQLSKIYYKHPWHRTIKKDLEEIYLSLGEDIQIQKLKSRSLKNRRSLGDLVNLLLMGIVLLFFVGLFIYLIASVYQFSLIPLLGILIFTLMRIANKKR